MNKRCSVMLEFTFTESCVMELVTVFLFKPSEFTNNLVELGWNRHRAES